jgi:hypothetical protein
MMEPLETGEYVLLDDYERLKRECNVFEQDALREKRIGDLIRGRRTTMSAVTEENETEDGLGNQRYTVDRVWPYWHVRCGTGTRSLFRSLRWIKAARVCGELTTAFHDGRWSATHVTGDDNG